jgi:hypothetical protein
MPYWYTLFEREPIGPRVHQDGIAFDEVAFEDPHRQYVWHATLNRSFERSRAVRGVVTLAHNLFLCRVGQQDLNLALFQPLCQSG